MKEPVAYDDAVDLLDADHKAVKKMFIDHAALCEGGEASATKQRLARCICQALTVHAQIEEEIFYPQVRLAIGNDALMDEALHEHAQAKEIIARIESMKAADAGQDAAVKQLGMLIDQHVMREREMIFLKASQAALDLRGMTLALVKRRTKLKKAVAAPVKEEA
jgi:hemerythrin superfamily protein